MPDWNFDTMIFTKLAIAGLVIATVMIINIIIQKTLTVYSRKWPNSRVFHLIKYSKWAMWLLAMLVCLQQLGIRLEFLNRIVLITLTVSLSTLGLVFSLSVYRTLHQVVAAHFFKKEIPTGSYIRIGDITGRVVDWSTLSVQLESDEGRVSLPMTKLEQEGFVLLRSRDNA